ncbi:hypothetical protein [Clostridium felsineum]|uniref:hypothetical protein n=1 Tax=Clostridium felsineum TaxID=36839 RepID=UPI001475348C|nr:hypothetical protein [Clostridium felsineum]MCR3760209.1 hypothetical protein [Clostridium felsineum]
MVIKFLIVVAVVLCVIVLIGVIGCIKAAGRADELERRIQINEKKLHNKKV